MDALEKDALEKEKWRQLLSHTGAQTQGLGDLLCELGCISALEHATQEQLASLPNATARGVYGAVEAWLKGPATQAQVDESARPNEPDRNNARPSSFHFLPITGERYPELLRCIPDPPPWMFVDGDVNALSAPCIAIVGTRRPSQQGVRAAQSIARDLASAGYTVCSGLALGIDGAAHQGALSAGSTAAVLASGLDRPSPRRHQYLAAKIRRAGCLVSELPLGTAPSKHQFPRRNRIISGLCSATIIVEAALPSGTLHTAAAALEQGREVYVLPWSVFHPQGRGCLTLLRDGATAIGDLDALGDFFPLLQESTKRAPASALGPEATRVLTWIGDGATSAEALSRELELPLGSLLVTLGELEVAGFLERCHGLYRRAGGGNSHC
ncbi:MAG: DNA-processing protein DprA [Pseudomonadota bacterium]